jgi:hypothetical protein
MTSLLLGYKLKFCENLIKTDGQCGRAMRKTGVKLFSCVDCPLLEVKYFESGRCDFDYAFDYANRYLQIFQQDEDNQI